MSHHPDVSEVQKDKIMDATSKVFAEKGVHGTLTYDIVKESRLSKGI